MNINISVIEARLITAEKSKSKIIFAKLETKESRSQLNRNWKISKSKTNILVKNWPIENKIFINKRFTKNKRILFAKTRVAAKDIKCKFTWISIEMVRTQKSSTSEIITA